jgi:hypothetical protein
MRKNLLFTFCVLCLAVMGLRAQGITSSSISGQVTDQKGDELPGANVVAVHVPSGTEYGISARADGRYNLNGLRVGGPYTVKTSFVGYKDQSKENIFLELGQTLVVNFKLADNATELETVVVSGVQDATLNSEKIGASSNFGSTQIQRLPSIARDFRDFTALTPQAGSGGFNFGGRSSLYNNLTIDGATANNVFGLSAVPAGQSATSPFSLDAIAEVTVQLSPYDLRVGNFTGAGISAVTRSGNNTLAGSAYYFFRNESFAGSKVAGLESPIPSFNFNNYGFRLGGPIIKNKLFFFVNAEFETRTDPFYTFTVRPTASAAKSATQTEASDDNDPLTGIKGLRDFLISTGYNPGVYKDFNRATESQRYVARFDYNINQNHKLTVRGNITRAFQDQFPSGSAGFATPLPGGRGNSNNVLSFSSSFYRINNNQTSVTAELNSTFKGGLFTNNLVVGYSAFRDFRQDAGGINTPSYPTVDILGPNGQNLTSFGPDPFTPNNLLDQDVTQVNDYFSIYLKSHTVTIGTANELYSFNNVFTPLSTGLYRYNSISEFIGDATASTTANFRPSLYAEQFVSVPGGPKATAAKWSALQLGFYAQDEFTGFKNLKITAGVRVDIPLYLTDLPANNYLNSLDFNGEKLRIGAWPEVSPLFSPRVGFNWDAKGDRTTQVRGGTGLLTGRIPFVWLSNIVSNNGLFFGTFNPTTVPFANTNDGAPYDYSQSPYVAPENQYANLATGTPKIIDNPLDRNFGRPAVLAGINTVSKNFKFPQVWRTNLAIDQKLPGGLVGTLEWIFTKDINAIYLRDLNIAKPVATVPGDGRPLFGAAGADRVILANDRRVQGDLTPAGGGIILDNTNKGYQWSGTLQLTKNFSSDFQLSAAYTYTDSREIYSQSGSTAGTAFNSQFNVLGPNNAGQSYAANLVPHRIVAYGNYRKEYAKHFASTIGFTYIGNSGSNFSYVYAGDLNSDGVAGNDLLYIPRNQSEILLTTTNATDNRSIDQIWQQLDKYINQDEYLSSHRGQYAERNGAYAPWVNQLNLSFMQDFYLDVKGHRNTIQLSVNLQNALNLFDSGAGIFRNPARGQLLNFVGYEQPHTAGTLATPVATAGPASTLGLPWAATTGRPIFTFNTNADGTPLADSFVTSTSVASRWQIQFGIRYIF